METNRTSRVLEIVVREVGVESVQPATSFAELGIDSLELVSILQAVESECGPIRRDAMPQTIAELEALVG